MASPIEMSACAGRGDNGQCAVMSRALPGCVESLRSAAAVLLPNVDTVIELWAERYRDRFGDHAFFDDRMFRMWHTEELSGTLERLEGSGKDGLAAWYVDRADRLRQMGAPFDELPLVFHLLERVVADLLDELRIPGETRDEARDLLAALGHARITIISRTYFGDVHCKGATEQACLLSELARLQRDVAGRDRFCGMVGASLPMQQLYETLTAAARGRATVLLVGESGTGKELAARAIHRLSGEPLERFVPVNCAALPDELIESELFGYRRGAFSGATGDRRGLFQAAHGGTLFLDEVTELPPAAQAKLLRALQERAVRSVGSTTEEAVDVRVVASTNLPLEQALDQGRLRRDLYYRLQGFVVHTPPLRRRLEDVPLLVRHFLHSMRQQDPRLSARGIEDDALQLLREHTWPGNVRELQMVIERACMTARGRFVDRDALPPELCRRSARSAPAPAAATPAPISLKEAERDAIVQALLATEGNKSAASRLLGISRKQLYVKIDRYGLQHLH